MKTSTKLDDICEASTDPYYNDEDEVDDETSGIYFERFASNSSTDPSMLEHSGQQYMLFSSLLPPSSSSPVRLNGVNILNVASYVANLSVAFIVGIWGLDGFVYKQWEIFEKYQTLITPSKWAYTIWIPIFFFEGVFAISQLHPTFRARPVLQEGVRYFYFYASLAQIAWAFLFTFRLFVLSFLSMFILLLSLISLLVSQYQTIHRMRSSRREYWFLRFPFNLHCGWIFVMTAVSFNMLYLDLLDGTGEHLAAAIVALSLLLPVAFYFLVVQSPPDLIVPAVLIWSYIGIALELQKPKESIQEQFEQSIIDGVRVASYWFAAVVSAVLIPRVFLHYCNEYLTIQVVQLDSEY